MNTTTHPALRRCLAALLATALSLLAAGCKSTPSATPGSPAAPSNAATGADPRPVAVYDFAFDVADLHADPGLLPGREGPAQRIRGTLHPEEPPARKAERLAALLSETIASELAGLKIPATRHAKDVPWPATGLVVKGEFLQVDEGNRLKRAVVGFGAGATETLAQVEIYDVAQDRSRPILVYGTGAGSKPTPGGVVTMNPYAMAARYVLSRNATEKDVRTLGRQIARDLARLRAETGAQP
jgi:hypothetical protein